MRAGESPVHHSQFLLDFGHFTLHTRVCFVFELDISFYFLWVLIGTHICRKGNQTKGVIVFTLVLLYQGGTWLHFLLMV